MIIEKYKTNKGYRYLVKDGDEIVSSAYILKFRKNKYGINIADISRVKTKEEYKNKGYAKKILSVILKDYKNTELHLHACPFGKHINKNNINIYRKKLFNLYEKFGFFRKPKTKSTMIRKININNQTLF